MFIFIGYRGSTGRPGSMGLYYIIIIKNYNIFKRILLNSSFLLGLAGSPGMPGERGALIFEDFSNELIVGAKGPKGFSGRKGEMGSPGYLCIFLFNDLIKSISHNCNYTITLL